jgi:hypothetical protein
MTIAPFNKVEIRYDLGEQPAQTELRSGTLRLNGYIWPTLSEPQKQDILDHEEGHYVLQTLDENRADDYAFQKAMRRGDSLKQTVFNITNCLKDNNPRHRQRAMRRLQLAIQYQNSMKMNQQYATCPHCDSNLNVGFDGAIFCPGCDDYEQPEAGLLGIAIGKKAKRRKEEKHAVKIETKRAKNESRLLLAKQGQQFQTGAGQFAQGIGGVLNNLFGNGNQPASPDIPAEPMQGPSAILSSPNPAGLPDGVKKEGDSSIKILEGEQPAGLNLLNQIQQQIAAIKPADNDKEKEKNKEKDKKKNQTMLIAAGVVVVVVVIIIILTSRKNG